MSKLPPFVSWIDAMICPQWLELAMSRINYHGPKYVRATEYRLYFLKGPGFTYENHFIISEPSPTLILASSSKKVSSNMRKMRRLRSYAHAQSNIRAFGLQSYIR